MRVIGFPLLCAAALGVFPGISLAQTTGLVAAYSFNEGSGTTITDLSGHNLTGTTVGATWTTAGKYGGALSFNGTTNYIDLGNPPLLRFTSSMTIEAWVRATGNPPDDGQIISKSDGLGGWQFKTSPDTGPETFGLAITGSGTVETTQRYSTTVRSLGTWYHVAGVYNAALGTMDIYVNGVLDSGALFGPSPIPRAQTDEAVNVNIGRRVGGFYFLGQMDELRVYNRALSQAEIQADMNTPLGGSAPPPDTTLPMISITAPASGVTVSGTTTVSANASDNIAVAGVQFLLDGVSLGGEVTASPYTLQWNTTTAMPGPHSLSAIARDTSNNKTTSAIVAVTVVAPPAAITLVQHAGVDAGNGVSTTTLAFPLANTAGNWIGVIVRASTSGQVFTVSDTRHNTYKKAVQLNENVDGNTVAIYYAENIGGGGNAITVSDTVAGTLRIAIFEYSGVAVVNSLDVFASASGTSAAAATTAVTTLKNGDLLLGAISTANPATFTAGLNFTIRERVPASGTKLAAEDRIQAAAGSATASATLGTPDNWGAVLAAFAAASAAPPPPIGVTIAPASANVTSGGPSQTFTATLQSDLQSKGVTWALSGAGCSGAACGTLTGVTTTAVTYNAPASIPVPATVKLTATSIADTTKSNSATITVLQGAVGVTVAPKRGAITTLQALPLSAVVTGDVGGAGVNWSTTGGTLGNQTTSSATFSSSTPGSFAVTATSKNDSTKSATVIIGVTDLAGVTTYHNNLSRDGSNSQEYALAPSTVNSSTFGKLFSCPVDGAVYAQPLWVPNLAISGGTHNVIFVATQHDSVYAFDADAATCTQFWKASMLDTAHGAATGATPVSPSDVSEPGDISGEIGITGTPVIDPVSRSLFVVSKTGEGSVFHQRLHALNLADGSDRVTPRDLTPSITVPGTADRGDSSIGCTSSGNNVPFCPLRENQRPGLVLANGLIYVAWGSHGDIAPYHGWVMSFNPSTLALVSAFNTSPNGRQGGIWMAGAAPAVDSAGNLYLITGNGDLTANTVAPPNASYGDSFLKLSSSLAPVDWFSPFDQSNLDSLDLDLGSGGAAILVDLPPSAAVRRLIVGGGKGTGFDGEIYVINRDNLGRFNSAADNVVQEFPLGSGIFATAAFWQNRLYIAAVGKPLTAFTLNPLTSTFSTPASSQSASSFGFPGATPSLSSSGAANGIVWAIDSSANGMSDTNLTRVAGPAVLHAYDATNLTNELWNSTQGTGNTAGNAVKFTVPTVANGRVFIGTRGNDNTQGSGTIFGQLDIYGLRPN